jgi:hypothetical protein
MRSKLLVRAPHPGRATPSSKTHVPGPRRSSIDTTFRRPDARSPRMPFTMHPGASFRWRSLGILFGPPVLHFRRASAIPSVRRCLVWQPDPLGPCPRPAVQDSGRLPLGRHDRGQRPLDRLGRAEHPPSTLPTASHRPSRRTGLTTAFPPATIQCNRWLRAGQGFSSGRRIPSRRRCRAGAGRYVWRGEHAARVSSWARLLRGVDAMAS